MQLLSPRQLELEIERLAEEGFCADPIEVIARFISTLTPPERISTTECATRERWIRNAEGDGRRLYSLDLTPYMAGIMDACDHDGVREVPVVGPGRCGKTMGFENHAFKRMKLGPASDVLWYLKSKSEVDNYLDQSIVPMFEDHPDLAAKLGLGRGDNTRDFKRFKSGRWASWLPYNTSTITNRQAGLIVGDEIDTYSPKLRDSFRQNMRQRGRAIGSRRKLLMASHADAGWKAGIALAWKESSRGIWVWPCVSCGDWSSPCPTAEHRTILVYDRDKGLDDDAAFALAKRTAAMKCPHCGTLLTDEERRQMVDLGRWMHRSQTLDPELGPIGEEVIFAEMGFWIHALMTKMVTMEQLAQEWEAARRHYERTRKPDLIRQFVAKSLGEVYEGATGAANALSGAKLAKRAEEGFERGTVPDDALFVVAAVDPGKRKFDAGFWGFDLEGRSWLIDRVTLLQRPDGHGNMVDLRPAERIDDWDVVRDQVLRRVLPLASDPSKRMPVAAIALDTGGAASDEVDEDEQRSGVTWKAREFARRMILAGEVWGQGANAWPKVQLIKGAKPAAAPELPVSGRKVSKDQEGKPVAPMVLEWDLGVHRLKMQAVERLAVRDGGPGQCAFAKGLPQSAFDEFTGEVLIDGAWDRRGPNESLDLFGYAEAARLLLRPDRADIWWFATDQRPTGRRPIWARPVPIAAKGGDPAAAGAAAPPTGGGTSIFERFDQLNGKPRQNG